MGLTSRAQDSKRAMHPTAEIYESCRTVEGWLTYEEGVLLHALAKACPVGSAIVEIGSYKGKSTIWLATGSRAGNGCMVSAIDPHTGSIPDKRRGETVWTLDAFRENIARAGVPDLVAEIVATSEQTVRQFRQPIGLIFIDGEHEYPFVRRDCLEWASKVVPGGVIALHDTMASSVNLLAAEFLPGWDGPHRVFLEEILGSPGYSRFGHVGTISYAVKTAASSEVRTQEIAHYLRSSRVQRVITRLVTHIRAMAPLARTVRKVKRLLR